MSTYINFRVKSRDELKNWIAGMLGYPLVTIEITPEQLDICIDNATEEYSKYAIHEQDYLGINLADYQNADLTVTPSVPEGIKLQDDVIGIFALNDDMISQHSVTSLFSIPNAMWNAGVMPSQLSSNYASGSWVTYNIALSYVKMVKHLMGGGFQFEYNRNTKMMKLWPNPLKEKMQGYIVLGCYIMRPEDQMYGESWVKRYALAQAKIIIGTIRSKFGSATLIGGGSVTGDLKTEGDGEAKELREQLVKKESGNFGFFIGQG